MSWSTDRILVACDTGLKDKVRNELVGVSSLEAEGLIIYKVVRTTLVEFLFEAHIYVFHYLALVPQYVLLYNIYLVAT